MKIHLSPPENYQGPKRSLILAGGGMRLAYQAGVLKALEEHSIVFNHADGTSGGTINLAMLLSGLSPDEMCHRWRKLRIKEFVSYMKIDNYLKPAQMVAFGDADGITRKVFPHLGINVNTINQAKGMNGTFNVCNYTDKVNKVVQHDQLTLDYLVAGISLPIFMPSVKIGNETYTDSVWIKDANLTEAVHRGAEELWLVWAIGNISQYKNGAFNQYVHMIEMSANGALALEFDYINELNQRIAKGDSPYGQTKPIKLFVIRPEYPLPLDPDLYFNKINTATLIDLGYADAKKYLKNLSPLNFTPAVTKMKDQGVVLCFRQTMKGNMNSTINGQITLCLSMAIQNLSQFLSTGGIGLQIAAHLQTSKNNSISSTCLSTTNVVEQNGKKIVRFSCQFRFDNKTIFLDSELNANKNRPTIFKGIFKNMNVRLYEGENEKGILIGETVLSPDRPVNGLTDIHILNEDSFWRKLAAKRKFIDFIKN